MKSDFESAVHLSNVSALNVERANSGHKSEKKRQVDVEEIEDDSWEELCAMSKSETHLLIHESEVHKEDLPPATKHPSQSPPKKSSVFMEEIDDEFWSEYNAKPKSSDHVLEENVKNTRQSERNVYDSETSQRVPTVEKPERSGTTFTLPPPPKELKPVRMTKKRFYPTGESSVGVSVLSVTGWVGHLNNSPTDLRLDSCADVTLISEEYYNSLGAKPPIQQGLRMKLWQLTDKDSSLKEW